MSDQQRHRTSDRSASRPRSPQRPANRGAVEDPVIEQYAHEDFPIPMESDEGAIEQRNHVLLWLALYDEAIRTVALWRQNTKQALAVFNPRKYDPENATFWTNKFSAYRLIKFEGRSPRHFSIGITQGDYPNEREVGVEYDLGDRGVFGRPTFTGGIDVSHIRRHLRCEPAHVQRFAAEQIAIALRVFHTVTDRIPGPDEKADRYSKRTGPVEVLRGGRGVAPPASRR